MSELKQPNQALLAMLAGKATPEAMKLAQVSKQVATKVAETKKDGPIGGSSSLNESTASKEREMPAGHFDAQAFMASKIGATPNVGEDAIQALMEGRGKSYTPKTPAANKPDPIAAANRLMETLSTKDMVPPTPPQHRGELNEVKTSSKELLKEIVLNLRRGGLLKEEILKIVLQEAMTEEVMLPLLEKHFNSLMKKFIQEQRKKS